MTAEIPTVTTDCGELKASRLKGNQWVDLALFSLCSTRRWHEVVVATVLVEVERRGGESSAQSGH